MITLRQHTISLAAVFLALAIGVVLGSGLLSDTLLSGLRADKQDMQNQIDDLSVQRNLLNERFSAAEDFDSQIASRVLHDALVGKSVVIIGTPDADDDDVDGLIRLVGMAGGSVSGEVTLTQQFVDANSAEMLRTVTSSAVPAGAQLSTTLVDQGSQAGDLLGIVLQLPRNQTAVRVDDAQRETALTALRDTGFLTYTQNITAADVGIVVTGGGLTEDAGNQGSTVARFAAAFAPHGWGTVLAGRDGSASGTAAVAVNRADPARAAGVSTVDDVDVESGRLTAVLALQDLINGGEPASYGTGPGATALTVAAAP
ncbi:MAG: copper transporter [Mycobacterium sp.]